jgi:hypothetical protein
MRASRPGGTRAGNRAAREGEPSGLEGHEAATFRRGAGRRLAAFLIAYLALSGHGRPVATPPEGRPDYRGVDATVAEVLVERNGAVVARGSAVVIAAREEAGEEACYVLTAGHVVTLGGGREASVFVRVPAADESPAVPAELLQQADADDRDLAVLRTFARPCHPARIGVPPGDGTDVWLAGFPASGGARVVPGHVRDTARRPESSWSVDGVVTEGTSGGGVFDARSGGLVGLIQGYWTVRLVGPAGRISGEAPAGRIAVIPMARVRALLAEWGIQDLLEE